MSVDILLSTYNGEKYLEEQIESILEQTHQNWKLIVRDDGSSDSSVQIIKTFTTKYSERIVFIEDEFKNLGACQSFAKLLEHSTAEYIMFCDQDDVWLSDKIEITLGKMVEIEKHYPEQPILVHTDLKIVDGNLKVISDSMWRYQKLSPERNKLNYLLVQNNVTGCTVMINKQLKEICAPIPEEAVIHDWWLALVASALGQIGYVNQPAILYRQHGKNDIGAKKYSMKYLFDRFAKRDKARELFTNVIKQARTFQIIFSEQIVKEEKEMLDSFSSILERGRISRIRSIIKYRFTKYGLLRNLGFLGFIYTLGPFKELSARSLGREDRRV